VGAHLVSNELHFVDQADVHCTVDIFQQLGPFCNANRAIVCIACSCIDVKAYDLEATSLNLSASGRPT